MWSKFAAPLLLAMLSQGTHAQTPGQEQKRGAQEEWHALREEIRPLTPEERLRDAMAKYDHKLADAVPIRDNAEGWSWCAAQGGSVSPDKKHCLLAEKPR